MTNEERNAALLQKMQGEQEQYRKWLLAQTPEEILSHTFEYTVRQDVLAEMEALKLCDEQADALLRSESPLADVYKTFRNMDTEYMDVIRSSIEDRAIANIQREREQREAMRNLPVYRYPAEYAREHGEMDAYRASYKANVACKEAIEQAIADNYRDNCLGRDAVKQVVDGFGYERTLHVLANTIKHKDWDGRISDDNKQWAATQHVFEDMDGFSTDRNIYYVVSKSHTGLIDLFATQARREYLMTIPLKREDIKAEALRILSQLQNAREPNSPNGTHFMVKLSQNFVDRAKDKDRQRLMDMLPFASLSLSTLEGRRGVFALISKDENRFQKLQLRKPSVLKQLREAGKEVKQTSAPKKTKEMEL